MNLHLDGKRVLITGSGRGLGRAMALSLANEGVRVAFVARSKSDINSLKNELVAQNNPHFGLDLDLTAERAPQILIHQLANHDFNELDIIVHNLGGTLDIDDPLCSVAEWRRVWRFNLEVAIELNLHFIPKMKEKRWGRIVHVSSISAMENHGPIPYCAVKAALNAYTRSLGRTVAPHGIVVSAVLPGAVWTEGGYWDKAMRERPEHVEKYLKERMAIGRLGQPEEIANFVTFLCSEHASFCIGSIVPIDGGQGRSFFGL